ncbi:MAG: hypothetical protein Q8L48_26790 [Archangium sp.]|nr:hypothetical protein [Archangium sp.]
MAPRLKLKAKPKKPTAAELVERELARLLARLSKPAADRWEADTAKVRHLLSLDADAVMKRLVSKQDEAVGLFSRLRTREGMVELCRSGFTTITFSELVRLDPGEQAAVEAFHHVLNELRWYVRYTEDMPSTVKSTVTLYVARLDELHHLLNAAIGPPDAKGHRVVDV